MGSLPNRLAPTDTATRRHTQTLIETECWVSSCLHTHTQQLKAASMRRRTAAGLGGSSVRSPLSPFDTLMQRQRSTGRVLRPSSLDELLDLMSEQDLDLLLHDLRRQIDKRLPADLHTKVPSQDMRLIMKQDAVVKMIEARRGIESEDEQRKPGVEKLFNRALEMIERIERASISWDDKQELRTCSILHLWFWLQDINSLFLKGPATLEKEDKRGWSTVWEAILTQLFAAYNKSITKSKINSLPKVPVAITSWTFLQNQLKLMSEANSKLDKSGDLNSDINACFIPTNEPKQASQAEIRLDVEMITAPDGSTWEAQFKKPSTCVTTDQLKGKKDALNESMMARLKNALHKEHYTSIVAQDTESTQLNEDLCQEPELVVTPIRRPDTSRSSGDGSSTSATPSSSKQADKAAKTAPPPPLSTAIPEGYTYRLMLQTYQRPPAKYRALHFMLELANHHTKLADGLEEKEKAEELQKQEDWKSQLEEEVTPKLDSLMATSSREKVPYFFLVKVCEQAKQVKRDLNTSDGLKQEHLLRTLMGKTDEQAAGNTLMDSLD